VCSIVNARLELIKNSSGVEELVWVKSNTGQWVGMTVENDNPFNQKGRCLLHELSIVWDPLSTQVAHDSQAEQGGTGNACCDPR